MIQNVFTTIIGYIVRVSPSHQVNRKSNPAAANATQIQSQSAKTFGCFLDISEDRQIHETCIVLSSQNAESRFSSINPMC